jgi:hypothetical protein
MHPEAGKVKGENEEQENTFLTLQNGHAVTAILR